MNIPLGSANETAAWRPVQAGLGRIQTTSSWALFDLEGVSGLKRHYCMTVVGARGRGGSQTGWTRGLVASCAADPYEPEQTYCIPLLHENHAFPARDVPRSLFHSSKSLNSVYSRTHISNKLGRSDHLRLLNHCYYGPPVERLHFSVQTLSELPMAFSMLSSLIFGVRLSQNVKHNTMCMRMAGRFISSLPRFGPISFMRSDCQFNLVFLVRFRGIEPDATSVRPKISFLYLQSTPPGTLLLNMGNCRTALMINHRL
ncbi:hypothetical protein CPB84DRAFT_1488790 [Gymnopilus junonius]|uniref:Uncharacterized protein n=1 Tax=Gymnopilus junonius TaxID=109634 RepID=A0A9P5TL10_GYMJU|nr:hypothetical protein CPB84DRAFT_1488790 [Gymnopilus junonius]